jgi:endonuclease-3
LSLLTRIENVLNRLALEYPDAHCALHHRNAFELLIATILSAQCTDERVNKTTPALFAAFPTPQAMGSAPLSEIEKLIHSCGFYRQKAKSLKQTSQDLVEQFSGEVPNDIDALVQLRGIGRKTANVVLGEIYNRPSGIVVDTHVKRISRLLGFTRQVDPEKIEFDLNRKVPPENWRMYSHWLITHGRRVCIARRPLCEKCPVEALCPKIGLPKKTKTQARQGGLKSAK